MYLSMKYTIVQDCIGADTVNTTIDNTDYCLSPSVYGRVGWEWAGSGLGVGWEWAGSGLGVGWEWAGSGLGVG